MASRRKPSKAQTSKPRAPKSTRGPAPSPVPAGRRGPRPLALHLATGEMAWKSLRAALPALGAGELPWPPDLANQAASLAAGLRAANPGRAGREAVDRQARIAEAIDREGERRMLAFTAGVRAYRDHPYRRDLAAPPVLWRAGTTRLLDYGAAPRPRGAVLVIPSLVNRAYVLDLTAKTSLMRHLARHGLRPFLVDWAAPGAAERGFGLDDYIAGRLQGALDAATAAHGGPVAVMGYCMGGTLAVALAQRNPDSVLGLACLAAPWDFQAEGPFTAPLEPAVAAGLRAAFESLPEMPVDLLQAMFASLDPFLVNRKYRAFAAAADGARKNGRDELFVAIEDWVNDGVPLAAKVASECLVGWYGGNRPALGTWQIAETTIDPRRLRCPALIIVPGRDRIVPAASAMALAAAIPRAESLRVPSGHVAMIVGEQAPRLTWRPLAAWLTDLFPARARAARRRA